MEKSEYATKLVEYSLEEQSLLMQTVKEGGTSPELQSKIVGIRDRNDKLLREVVFTFGWPKISEFGIDASSHAWLLMQHSSDLVFQEKCLNLMRALPNNEINKYNQATTEDRISMRTKFAVKYGNNRFSEGTGFNVIPVENSVDELESNRAKVELEPLGEAALESMTRYKFDKVIFATIDKDFAPINS